MCGPPTHRPSSGGRIAVMFPSSMTIDSSDIESMTSPYSLFFHDCVSKGKNSGQCYGTRAIFRIEDERTLDAFKGCERIDLRIEKYGDLTSAPAIKSNPLHQFHLLPAQARQGQLEFELPERLDLGVSDVGILGRQVTVSAEGPNSSIIGMGTGVVGYD